MPCVPPPLHQGSSIRQAEKDGSLAATYLVAHWWQCIDSTVVPIQLDRRPRQPLLHKNLVLWQVHLIHRSQSVLIRCALKGICHILHARVAGNPISPKYPTHYPRNHHGRFAAETRPIGMAVIWQKEPIGSNATLCSLPKIRFPKRAKQIQQTQAR